MALFKIARYYKWNCSVYQHSLWRSVSSSCHNPSCRSDSSERASEHGPKFLTLLSRFNDEGRQDNHSGRGYGWPRRVLLPLGALAAVLLGQVNTRRSYVDCAEVEAPRLGADEELAADTPQSTAAAQEMLREAIAKARDMCCRVKDETGSPGLVVAVSVNGKQVWAEGMGYADIENRVACKPDTVMRIASISKSVTMAIVAKLAEEGKLDLNKPVTDYVKAWPVKYFNGKKVDITTYQLVSQTGGVRHYSKDCGRKKTDEEKKEAQAFKLSCLSQEKAEKKESVETKQKDVGDKAKKADWDFREFYLKERFSTVEAALNLFKDDPLCSKPGTEYLYTTHGWTLVSAVIEGVAGKKFPDMCRQLFRDLGLTHTYLDEPTPLIYNRSRFYCKNKKGRLVNTPYVDNSYKWAGGGMLSTVEDLLKFGNAMLYAYQQQDGCSNTSLPGYLQAKTMRQMWTPVSKTKCDWDAGVGAGYGQGWGVVPQWQAHGQCQYQEGYVSHTGGAIGASSVLLVLPRDSTGSQPPHGVVVTIIVNLTSVGLNKTALDIAKVFQDIDL